MGMPDDMLRPEIPTDFRAGFACFVGRPNTGKSTLTNALVGSKVAITSAKPQTTRRAIRGIVNRTDAQLVIVDTPGLHRPRTLLGERLNDVVRTALSDVDVIGFCVPADQAIGAGDRYIAGQLAAATRVPVLGIVTKSDLAAREELAERLVALQTLSKDTGLELAEIVPVSAVAGSQVQLLADLLVDLLPQSLPLYPPGDVTDEPQAVLVAELIREAALEGVRDELPHSLAVTVDEIEPRPDRNLVDVHAVVWVERQSQKAIVIGTNGSRLKAVGTAARQEVQALLGKPVYLDLRVKVAKDWQRDPRQLRRLGF
jgi:GTPase